MVAYQLPGAGVKHAPAFLLGGMLAASALIFGAAMFAEPRSQPMPQVPELPTTLCMDEPTREHIRTLMLTALDESLKSHLNELFEVWMAQSTDPSSPKRAQTGMARGIDGYMRSRLGAQKWNPPLC
jgi:hypothetical protein